MTTTEKNLLAAYNSVGPMLYDEREAVLDLFRKQAHRFDMRTRGELYTALKRPMEDKLKELVDRTAQLEDTASHLVGIEDKMSDADRTRFSALIDKICQLNELVEQLV